MWDVETLKCLSTLTGHSGAVRALAASSKRVFSGSDDTTIKVGAIVGILHLFQIIMPVSVHLQEA